jgi:hypothetical protein
MTTKTFIDLTVEKLMILTPTKNDVVRYYARLGMDDIFMKLITDPPKDEASFNIALIGTPRAGKSNLVWAVADHLASDKTVLWVSHRLAGAAWKVRLFEPNQNGTSGCVSEVTSCPNLLSEILNNSMFRPHTRRSHQGG